MVLVRMIGIGQRKLTGIRPSVIGGMTLPGNPSSAMRIDQKLTLFRDGKLAVDHLLSAADLAAAGVTDGRYLKQVLFEKNSWISSGSIGADARTFLGSGSYMNGGGYLRGQVFIGRYCSIGRRITIGAGHHLMSGLSTSPRLSRGAAAKNYTQEESLMLGIPQHFEKSLPVEIGCDVWIGDGVVVMPGVKIAHGAVIGANAVVTRDVPPYAIVAGVPARILRYRFPAQIVEALLLSRWWDYPSEKLQTLPLRNILSCLETVREWSAADADYQTFALQS